MKNQKGFLILTVILAIVFVAVVGMIGYWVYKPYYSSNWKTYTNNEYGFQIKYPQTFSITKDVNYAPRIILENAAKDKNSEFSLYFDTLKRNNLTLEEFIHSDTAYEQDKTSGVYDIESVSMVNGVTVYKFRKMFGCLHEYHVFFLKNSNEGTDSYYSTDNGCDTQSWIDAHPEGVTKNPYKDVFDQVISTFTFIK